MIKFRASCVALSVGLGLLFGSLRAEETVIMKDGKANTTAFAARPPGATNQFQIGSPKFEAGMTVVVALGGPDVMQLLTPTFENYLFDTKRFQVKKGGVGSFAVVGSVTSFAMKQGKESAPPQASNFLSGLVGKVVKSKDPQVQEALASATTVNIKSETEKLTIACAVTVQLLDGDNTILEKGTSKVSTEVTVKEMRVALGGVNVKDSDPTMTVVAQYNTQVVERAIYNAIVEMVPKLDERLANPEFINKPVAAQPQPPAQPPVASMQPAQGGPTPAQVAAVLAMMGGQQAQPAPAPATPTAPAAAPAPASGTIQRAAFCSQCGGKLGAEAKFCSGCGSKIAHD